MFCFLDFEHNSTNKDQQLLSHQFLYQCTLKAFHAAVDECLTYVTDILPSNISLGSL